ncbi:CLUMA_CG004774, isoform A [Clunio marinus]|uniref:CLUMA_CG004774, isoform A n=1 Tax=Clunio marinus TaxID=568069 RepID=A0A1J1HX34_9DIPT|nr:CLUMA_CG004774, isoform A [Clunio marinus]
MLKHIPIPTIPPPSSTAVGSSASTTFATTPTRPSRPLLTLNRSQQPLNVSTLTTASNITSNGGPSLLQTYSNTPLLTHSFADITTQQHPKPLQNGHAPRMFTPLPALSANSQQFLLKNFNNHNQHNNNASNATSSSSTSKFIMWEHNGAREALTSLGLLCLVSLLLALLSLIFLLKISPGTKSFHNIQQQLLGSSVEEYAIVFDVTLALCALSLSLNLCCLLVCAIQFLFAVKLVGSSPAIIGGRENKYLQKSSVSRICAIGGFFISIPIFLTGIILYTFTQFHSTPAIVTNQINNHSYVNGGGLAHINTTLNNTHLSLLSQAVTPNPYFGLRTTPPTPKSQQMHNGSPNNSANLDQSNNFRNSSVTTAHELSTLV